MKQRIIKTLTVILFGLMLSVKMVAAENWVPEWVSVQTQVSVRDITDLIRKEAGEDFLPEGGKCFLAIQAQALGSELWQALLNKNKGLDYHGNVSKEMYYYYEYDSSNSIIFLPIQVYCTEGITYTNNNFDFDTGSINSDGIGTIYGVGTTIIGANGKDFFIDFLDSSEDENFHKSFTEFSNSTYNYTYDIYYDSYPGSINIYYDNTSSGLSDKERYTQESVFYSNGQSYEQFFKNNNIEPYVALPPVTPDNPNNSTTPPRPNTGTNTNRPSGFVQCSDIDVDKIKACGCIPAGVADITSKIYFILRIVGPVLLLILGGFDMAKAVASQDESSITKAKKKLVNKFIAAAAIFFVLTIMEFVVGIFAKNAEGILKCIYILLDGYVI